MYGAGYTIISYENPAAIFLAPYPPVSRVAIEISFQKIPLNRLRTVFVIPRNKVLILCDSGYFRRLHSVNQNETERNSAK
jgi:hypothetical protein